jgi:complexin-1/2
VEQERLRQEAIKQAEKERRDKYRKQEEEREHLRQGIRDKVNKYSLAHN